MMSGILQATSQIIVSIRTTMAELKRAMGPTNGAL